MESKADSVPAQLRARIRIRLKRRERISNPPCVSLYYNKFGALPIVGSQTGPYFS